MSRIDEYDIVGNSIYISSERIISKRIFSKTAQTQK